jgi:hypothetical protein
MSLYWCPRCGVVWADDDGPPICTHFIPPSLAHPPARMEPLPPHHPYAKKEDDER